MNRPELVVRDDPQQTAVAAADRIEQSAATAIGERGRFRIALAGGGTPRLAYQELARPERARRIAWQAWQVFFGDERAVPADHEQSNFRMAQAALLSRVPIPQANIHRVQGGLGAALAAERYEAELGAAPLDLVLLGIGEDGHTASLFPGSPALDERQRRVVNALAPSEPRARVTLTLRAVSEARDALFLVTGQSKARRVAEVLAQIENRAVALPAARVRPQARLWFYLDRAAAPGS